MLLWVLEGNKGYKNLKNQDFKEGSKWVNSIYDHDFLLRWLPISKVTGRTERLRSAA